MVFGSKFNNWSMFKAMTTHDIPMVRKFASKSLGSFLKVLLPNQEKEILDMVNNVIKDDQDLVRIYMVDALIPLAGLLAPQKYAQVLMPMFNTLADDQSWRIKYAICEKCQEVWCQFLISFLFWNIIYCFHLKIYLISAKSNRLEKLSPKTSSNRHFCLIMWNICMILSRRYFCTGKQLF